MPQQYSTGKSTPQPLTVCLGGRVVQAIGWRCACGVAWHIGASNREALVNSLQIFFWRQHHNYAAVLGARSVISNLLGHRSYITPLAAQRQSASPIRKSSDSAHARTTNLLAWAKRVLPGRYDQVSVSWRPSLQKKTLPGSYVSDRCTMSDRPESPKRTIHSNQQCGDGAQANREAERGGVDMRVMREETNRQTKNNTTFTLLDDRYQSLLPRVGPQQLSLSPWTLILLL